MKKYKLKTRIGQTVYKIEVNVRASCPKYDTLSYKDGVFVTAKKIIYQTDRRIALNDKYITVLDRQAIDDKKESYNHFIEYPSISIKTKETYFPNGVFGSMYTIGDPKKAIVKLTKAMERKVSKDYGFLFNVDVSGFVDNWLDNNKIDLPESI